jgi:phosphatidate cytidylyltransferase
LNNFVKRAITGAVYVALTIFCLLFSMDTAFLYIFIINAFCLYELISILHPDIKKTAKWGPICFSALLFFHFLIGLDQLMFPGNGEGLVVLFLFGFLFYEVFSSKSQPFQYLGTMVLGFLYVSFSLILLLKIGINEEEFIADSKYFSGQKILAVFILIWASDTFAYLAGRAFGKRKLAPDISPGKTVGGAVGGFIGTIGVAWILFETMGDFRLLDYLVIGSIAFLFGLLGDLLVSRLKRSMDIKDSGSSLPGHGGFLDRFDSILIAGPIIFVYLLFVS